MYWGAPTLGLVLLLTMWYTLASHQTGVWLQGGSLPALMCGIAAGLIVFFELLLGLRKRLRAWRLLPARYWLAAHLWLGLAALPLAILHSGFRLGGWLPAILLFVLGLTYLSGLFGWLMQHFIPPLMLKVVPGETITSEIEAVSSKNLADLRQMLTGAFGPSPEVVTNSMDHRTAVLAMELEAWTPSHGQSERALTISAMRDSQRVSSVPTVRIEPNPSDAERIWQAFSDLMPYVLRGKSTDSWLKHQPASDSYFENLSQLCDISTRPIVDVMKSVCDQRRQFDVQRTLNTWLVIWIPFHAGLGSALGVLLIIHVITALRYW